MYKLNKNFNKFIYGIGGIPATYIESLTYEEQLLWFCKNLSELINNVSLGVSFDDYEDMVAYFNTLEKDTLNVGQPVFINDSVKIDLYLSEISNSSSTYHFSSESAVINEIKTNGVIQFGYYKFKPIEGLADLSNYVTNNSLTSTLLNYVTNSSLSTTLSDYVTSSSLSSTLASYELISNKVTSLSASSTDTEYPSAKCVYDIIGNVETLLSEV